MKNTVIVLLVIVIVGLGGWIVYDKTKTSNRSNAGSSAGGAASDTSGAHVVDLSNKNLTSVGPDVYNKTDTTTLILSYNQISSLPSQMGQMTNVQTLIIDHNKLQGALIAEIRKMPLRVLNASYNQMTGVPAEIGQLNQLQTLDYSHNNIDTLPNEIKNLKNLKELNLTGNPLPAATISDLRVALPNTTIIF